MIINKSIMKLCCFLVLAVVSMLCIVPATAASSKVIAIDAGESLSLALKDDGTVMAWGTMMGFLPNSTSWFFQSYTPVAVNITNVSAISAGNFFVLFLKNDGTVWGWGDNQFGEFGDGTNKETSLDPVQVAGLHDIIAISTSGTHCLALRRDGTVWSWGWNVAGQLGIGTTSRGEYTPVQVPGLSNVKKISAGDSYSMAIDGNGTLWAWGSNDKGRLGDGTTIMRLSPVQALIDNVADVKAGVMLAHTVALKSDGTVWAWGWNQEDELGFVPGKDKECHTPVQVKGIDNVAAISSTDSNSIALKKDGTVWIWGNGQQGRLGNGASYSADTPTPLQVPGLKNIIAIAGGYAHVMALSSDGSVYTWGDNSYGQIGNGKTNTYNTSAGYPEGATKPTLIIPGINSTTTPTSNTITTNVPAGNNPSQNVAGTQQSSINYVSIAGILGIILLIGIVLYVFIKNKK